LFFLMCRLPPSSPLFPYTTLFRSDDVDARVVAAGEVAILVQVLAARGEGQVLEVAFALIVPGRREDVLLLLQRRAGLLEVGPALDRKSTRLNSSHVSISYAVFCLK